MTDEYEYETEFVEKNLIAYIGNKRRLLPLIVKAIKETDENGSQKLDRHGLFVDFFAGTGVVSRLAKSLGFNVHANDWETYSYIINRTYVEENENLFELFEKDGGINKVLQTLNELDKPIIKYEYIASYYCPKSDDNPDYNGERLFYTRQNGILIDNIRATIDYLYPQNNTREQQKKRNCLISLLLYEASVRSNTNGVFKGFHQGFGGRNEDALGRIKRKLKLTKPHLSRSKKKCKVTQKDALLLAEQLLKGEKAEIVYLDPPYNQHQYGSNYHLLNTIANNDKPTVNREFMIEGKKINKSAIRKDWKKTKSSYCYKKTALEEFKKLVSMLNTKYILVSYSTEGIIPFDKMLEVLATRGQVGIVTTGYVRFRGGRQSNQTKNKNVEFILIVDTGVPCSRKDLENVKGLILQNNILNIFEETFLLKGIDDTESKCQLLFKGMELSVYFKDFDLIFKLTDKLKLDLENLDIFEGLTYFEKKTLYENLKKFYTYTNDQEVHWILDMLLRKDILLDRKYLLKRLFILFNKINPQKNAEAYAKVYRRLDKFYYEIDQSELLKEFPLAHKHFAKILEIRGKNFKVA